MGTMGTGVYLSGETYGETARASVATVRGRIPLLVGVMDNSCERVLERVAIVNQAGADGVVATTPFYHALSQAEVAGFFRRVSRDSPLPLYIYDLPGVTKTPVAPETVLELMDEPNIIGLKSGNLLSCKMAAFEGTDRPDFTVMYSGIDTFDVAYAYGITRNLDGMFSCTPEIASAMYRSLADGQLAQARQRLRTILDLRDAMAKIGIFRGFTAVMNQLGYAGSFHPDYVPDPTDEERAKLRDSMTSLGIGS
jgi:4-hydroxy-tetrahydrodipicolinate synthase